MAMSFIGRKQKFLFSLKAITVCFAIMLKPLQLLRYRRKEYNDDEEIRAPILANEK